METLKTSLYLLLVILVSQTVGIHHCENKYIRETSLHSLALS
jgi:hypothetical protein